MNDIAQIQSQRYKESEVKRQNNEIKNQQDAHHRQYKKIVNHNEAAITEVRKDYDVKVEQAKTELEKKLIEMRKKHEDIMTGESTRMDQEVENLKNGYQDKVTDMKVAQEKQIEDMNENFKVNIENARQKYLKAKMKWDT